jgi:hypothetical protein
MIRKQRFIEKKQRMLEQCKQEQDRELILRQVKYLAKQADMLYRQQRAVEKYQRMLEIKKQREDQEWMKEQEKIASGKYIHSSKGH